MTCAKAYLWCRLLVDAKLYLCRSDNKLSCDGNIANRQQKTLGVGLVFSVHKMELGLCYLTIIIAVIYSDVTIIEIAIV